MTRKDLKLIDDAIIEHGDDFWNDENELYVEEGEQEGPNRGWIIEELLDILYKEGLDLKVVKSKS